MKSRLEKVLDKMPNKKVDLKAHKVALGLIEDIDNELESFEQSESEASYLAYEWGDEIMDAYSELSLRYNIDDFIVNGSTTMLGEMADRLRSKLDEVQVRANELGLDVEDVYDGFNYLYNRVTTAQSLSDDAKAKYREVINVTGSNDFWR